MDKTQCLFFVDSHPIKEKDVRTANLMMSARLEICTEGYGEV